MFSKLKLSEDHFDFAENYGFTGIDRFIGFVLRQEPGLTVDGFEAFDRGFFANEGNNDGSVVCKGLLADDDFIAVEDAGIYHGVAPDTESKVFTVVGSFIRQVAFQLLHSKNGHTGSNGANNGDSLTGFIDKADCTVLGAFSCDQAMLFQSIEMELGCGRRVQPQLGANLADSGRKSVFFDAFYDTFVNRSLFISQRFQKITPNFKYGYSQP